MVKCVGKEVGKGETFKVVGKKKGGRRKEGGGRRGNVLTCIDICPL